MGLNKTFVILDGLINQRSINLDIFAQLTFVQNKVFPTGCSQEYFQSNIKKIQKAKASEIKHLRSCFLVCHQFGSNKLL